MDPSMSQTRPRAETFTPSQKRWFLGVGFLTLFVLCLTAVFAPSVYVTAAADDDVNVTSCAAKGCSPSWSTILSGVQKLNQYVVIEAQLRRPEFVSPAAASDMVADFEQALTIQARAGSKLLVDTDVIKRIRCPPSEEFCEPMILFFERRASHPSYQVFVRFHYPIGPQWASDVFEPGFTAVMKAEMVNAGYNRAILGWKAMLAITTLIFSYNYLSAFRKTASVASYEQRWVMALLGFTFLFNEPWMAGRLFAPHLLWDVADAITITVFLCSILLCWLCVFDSIRKGGRAGIEPGDRRFMFYIPKLLTIFVIFNFTIVVYALARVQRADDPTWTDGDVTGLPIVRYTALGLSLCLFAHILWVGHRAFGSMNDGSPWTPLFHCVLVLTIFAILLIGLLFFFAVYRNGLLEGLAWALAYLGPSLYVWMLSHAYTPVPQFVTLEDSLEQGGAAQLEQFTDQEDDSDSDDEDGAAGAADGAADGAAAGDADRQRAEQEEKRSSPPPVASSTIELSAFMDASPPRGQSERPGVMDPTALGDTSSFEIASDSSDSELDSAREDDDDLVTNGQTGAKSF